jgi:drug/metabolite transporter (DMT)-like permease
MHARCSPKITNEQPNQPNKPQRELGLYLFAGNLLQVIGMQTVPADRAAFLLQLTTLFVPVAQAAVDRSTAALSSPRVWIAGLVALAGVAVLGLDSDHDSSNIDGSSFLFWHPDAVLRSSSPQDTMLFQLQQLQALQWSTGDALIVLAAVAYTFHCIRLEKYAQTTSAIQLAACKASTETALSAAALLVAIAVAAGNTNGNDHGTLLTSSSSGFGAFLQQAGTESIVFLEDVTSSKNGRSMLSSQGDSALLPALLATAWTGLVPVAYTIAAQSYGQRRVRPVTANLIYTVQPICTALFAFLLLRETLGAAGFAGGAMIAAAVLLVVAAGDDDDNSTTTQ